jgi:hypothetical protein
MINSKLLKTVNKLAVVNVQINILRKRGVGGSYSEYVKRGNRGNIQRNSLETYPCKFDYQCKLEGKFKKDNYSCTHGGGISCRTWRRKTNLEIGSRRLPGDA